MNSEQMLENKKTPSRKIIASVQHALDILNLFGAQHAELGNAEIAKMLNMDTGTAAGLIHTLKVNNYLDQNPNNRRYRLGLKLAERGAVLLDQLDLRKVAAPYLEELRNWCGESINLGIRDQKEVVYIERLFGTHSLGIRSELGKRAPLHSTALGKVLLAYMNPQEVKSLLGDYVFTPVTPHTIIDPDFFITDLEQVRKNGFAMDEQENEMGGRCLAAPIFDRNGKINAAISVSVPIQRFPVEKIPEYGKRVIAAGYAISHNLGYEYINRGGAD
jgi:IclR family KDG regulon transcriptional repressor